VSAYATISAAIDYIASHRHQQPGLDDIAAHVHLSPFHFQRLFAQWVGVSPKRFLQVLTVEQAKQQLSRSRPLLDISEAVGLSSGSRLYDHFVTLEAATPGEVKNQGAGLEIYWDCGETPFGHAFIATTPRGICKLAFLDADYTGAHCLAELERDWPAASLAAKPGLTENLLNPLFSQATTADKPLSLYVKGSNFQVQVWKSLLRIQSAEFASYGDIARYLGKPGSARAVGGAVGSNPVGLLIPCHRVIRETGELGGYRWGEARKRCIHAWEAARVEKDECKGR
jgi:AraC family transcriptional regulator, regulatory protein of adaptative response / methylated-DNA-[protein]-cysteine methyltransferase